MNEIFANTNGLAAVLAASGDGLAHVAVFSARALAPPKYALVDSLEKRIGRPR